MDYSLARLPVFRGLPPAELAGLERLFKLRTFAKGAFVFEEGEKAGGVYLLRSGLVKAVKYSPQDEPVIMQIIAPGHLFGMLAVMDEKSYPVSAVCVHDCEAYFIREADFSGLLARHPAFSKAVYAEMGLHLRHGQALRALAKEPADRRIAFLLWLLSGTMGRELKLRREDIAEMAGTTAATATRVLIGLRAKKLIAARWKRITIEKPGPLKAYAEGAWKR